MLNIDLLSIRHLRAVLAISQTRNLTRAARKLCVSQPAVSQQLKEVEQILGIPLFVRTKKEMVITRAGEEVLQSAQLILEELDGVSVRISRLVNGEVGELKIGMHCVLSYQWITEVLKTMQRAHPKVELTLGNCHRPKKELLEKVWDVVIAGFPFDHPLLGKQVLFSDDIVLVAHPKEPVAQKPVVSPGDLRGSRYLSLTTRDMDISYNVFIAPDDPQACLFMTVEQPDAILAMIRDGFGVAVLPKWAVQRSIRKKEMVAVPLTPDGLKTDWHAVTLKSKDKKPYFESFVSYCKDAWKTISRDHGA